MKTLKSKENYVRPFDRDEPSRFRPLPEAAFDSTVSFLKDPYRFISWTCNQLQTDRFITRLFLQKTICLRGAAAAELFYNEDRFQRAGASPRRVQITLFGKGGIQGLDDVAHQHRKAMFLELIAPEQLHRLSKIAVEEWDRMISHWKRNHEIIFYEAAKEVLFRAAWRWAGLPLMERDVLSQAREVASTYEQAGSIGLTHWQARWTRIRLNQRFKGLIEQIRTGALATSPDCAASLIAHHRNLRGELLPAQVAGVELQNVIRPITAVSVFITQGALALRDFPDWRDRLKTGNSEERLRFVQEVRRFYPFFPAVMAQVRQDFEWQGALFKKGTRTLLDLYGTNHDSHSWERPDEFQPERFRNWSENPFTFIPQGGGSPAGNHRCPGDQISIEMMSIAIDYLCRQLKYSVPEQNFRLTWSQPPALPQDRFIIHIS